MASREGVDRGERLRPSRTDSGPSGEVPRVATPLIAQAPAARASGGGPQSLTVQDVIRLQRTIGNQAVGRLLARTAQRQAGPEAEIRRITGAKAPAAVVGVATGRPLQRVVVQSEWLKMQPSPKADKKKAEMGEPTIYTATSVAGPYVECTDTTSAGYRDGAEKALGSLVPFSVLAKWGIIPPSGRSGANPFARAHLIAAEFGGQLQYSDPSQNIRFHGQGLEYGDWQQAENRVKRKGKRGFITARSTEARAAALTARTIIDLIRDTLSSHDGQRLEAALRNELKAADFVPFDVGFDYTDVDDSEQSFTRRWSNQDAPLTVQPAAAGAVYGALQELGILGSLGIGIPGELAASSTKPDTEISSRASLITLLHGLLQKKDEKRKKTVLAMINKQRLLPPDKFGDMDFAKQLAKLPEMGGENSNLKVTGNFRSWLTSDLTVNDL